MSNEVTKTEVQEFEKKKEKVRTYTNGEVTVYWQAEKCIHSANCIIGLPTVFNAQKRPWITITGADSDEVIKTIDTCPSRALLYLKNQATPAVDEIKTPGAVGTARVQILMPLRCFPEKTSL
ncbi:MAG: (4Fe-4S)-binding protein [Bacteroidota bacterium]